MSMVVLGGFSFQWPTGMLAGRHERRLVLSAALVAAGISWPLLASLTAVDAFDGPIRSGGCLQAPAYIALHQDSRILSDHGSPCGLALQRTTMPSSQAAPTAPKNGT